MAVRIRLTRVGATKRPSYRVVAIDRRRARDGRALEILGFYDPLTDPATVRLDTDRIKAWIGRGAQPSETVVKLMRQAEGAARPAASAPPAAPKRTRTRRTTKAPEAKAEGAKAEGAKAEGAKAEEAEPEASGEAGGTEADTQKAEA